MCGFLKQFLAVLCACFFFLTPVYAQISSSQPVVDQPVSNPLNSQQKGGEGASSQVVDAPVQDLSSPQDVQNNLGSQDLNAAPPANTAAQNVPVQSLPASLEHVENAMGGDAATLPHDLSPYGMFMQADWVVKSVMISLGLASLLTWIILIVKAIELTIAKRKMRRTVYQLLALPTLEDAIEIFSNQNNISSHLIQAAIFEVQSSMEAVDGGAGNSGLKERVNSALSRIEAHAGRRMASGSGILATIGSISPFVGLLGTVWGIMNAFVGISKSQVTNLAVVAPGIAEALLATAIGLVAAIPAVVIYNYLAKSIVGYRQIVADAAASIERLISRDLDFREAHNKSRNLAHSCAGE